ncbi:uncharacterized protein LOC108622061 [Ceratina calcarata]|uniref:Uncharacterized protein LOC108622061 n=1 Tax=Ceratina calcarata TaxID=156304 RepID=A0AAJ7IS41_9HYME|nr:uncharacterized protein LOC108622061 [Ceratina calcarata]
MQVYVTLLAFAVILVASIESKPIWSNLYLGAYPSEAISIQPQLLQHSPYYIYNVHANVNAVPAAVIANGKPSIPHLPTYGFYYGNPIYDFRFPLSPVYPILKPGQPGELPRPSTEPTTTTRPVENSEGGIEKLDTKVEPDKETSRPNESEENDDSVIIESI